MKRPFTILVGAAGLVAALSTPTGATGDTYTCPAGTIFDYKIEPLSGLTFTVPTPPQPWHVTAVVLKVGGPGGGTHITFTPVTHGQVLSVAYQQHTISHAHICKGKTPSPTTTTTPTTTTSMVSTTTSPPTTTTPPTTTNGPTTTTSPPSPTTTVAPTTTTSPQVSTTSIPDTTSTTPTQETTSTVEQAAPPAEPLDQARTALPATGSGWLTAGMFTGAACVALGALAYRLARRP